VAGRLRTEPSRGLSWLLSPKRWSRLAESLNTKNRISAPRTKDKPVPREKGSAPSARKVTRSSQNRPLTGSAETTRASLAKKTWLLLLLRLLLLLLLLLAKASKRRAGVSEHGGGLVDEKSRGRSVTPLFLRRPK
jgi:hypothetical protein